MKLDALLEKKQEKGTYVGAKFSSDTIDRLKKFVKDHNIPNGLDADDFHTTVIYSRKFVPDLDVEDKIKKAWIGTPEKLEIFNTQSGWKALVLRYDCPKLVKIHEKIMDTTEATYDWPEYKVHVTLSYNIEDHDENEIKKLSLDAIGDIEITKLYVEDLKLDWADKTVKKKD